MIFLSFGCVYKDTINLAYYIVKDCSAEDLQWRSSAEQSRSSTISELIRANKYPVICVVDLMRSCERKIAHNAWFTGSELYRTDQGKTLIFPGAVTWDSMQTRVTWVVANLPFKIQLSCSLDINFRVQPKHEKWLEQYSTYNRPLLKRRCFQRFISSEYFVQKEHPVDWK